MLFKFVVFKILTLLFLISCNEPNKNFESNEGRPTDWKTDLQLKLKTFGHRNWIVVADAAYPQQSNQAIETITVDTSPLETIKFVNRLIEKAPHVNATIYMDKEIDFVLETQAKGITAYRNEVFSILDSSAVTKILHENLIQRLDDAAALYNILVIKTNMTIPYTSLFFELECGYWNSNFEDMLRKNSNQNIPNSN